MGRNKLYSAESRRIVLNIVPSQYKEIEELAIRDGKSIPLTALKLVGYGLDFCQERSHLDVKLLPSQYKEIEELASVEGKSVSDILSSVIEYGLIFCKGNLKGK